MDPAMVEVYRKWALGGSRSFYPKTCVWVEVEAAVSDADLSNFLVEYDFDVLELERVKTSANKIHGPERRWNLCFEHAYRAAGFVVAVDSRPLPGTKSLAPVRACLVQFQ